jgi:hypothetical protein
MDVKKLAIIYEAYMWVLHIWNRLMQKMQVLHNVHFDHCKP